MGRFTFEISLATSFEKCVPNENILVMYYVGALGHDKKKTGK